MRTQTDHDTQTEKFKVLALQEYMYLFFMVHYNEKKKNVATTDIDY